MATRSPAEPPGVEGGVSLLVAWRLDGKKVLVVGGGAVAAGRVRAAREADAEVTVVSPALEAEDLRTLAASGAIVWRSRRFVRSDLVRADMVMTAIDDEAHSRRIAILARARRIPVNVADVPPLCDFWFTSVHREGALQIAVSTNGRAPGLASRIRRQLADRLAPEASKAVERFGVLRDAVRRADPAAVSAGRRMGWLAAIGRKWSLRALGELSAPGIRRLVDAYRRNEPPGTSPGAGGNRGAGGVAVVGAGPGSSELLTVAARRAVATADLVVADRLISREVLALVDPSARTVRRRAGGSLEAQREVEAWVVEAARDGARVVRLKQGDPFVFGRAGEELECYARAGLKVTVIPGISSALAAPLVAGVPLTLRGVADRFVVATGQGANGTGVDVPPFDPRQTLVMLMAVGKVADLQVKLRWAGYPREWPVAVIERASQRGERIVTTTAGAVAPAVAGHRIQPPAVIVVGRVVDLPARLERYAKPSAASEHRDRPGQGTEEGDELEELPVAQL